MTHALKEKTGPAPGKGATPNVFIARCGVETKTAEGMTVWESDVTCGDCHARGR